MAVVKLDDSVDDEDDHDIWQEAQGDTRRELRRDFLGFQQQNSSFHSVINLPQSFIVLQNYVIKLSFFIL